MANIKHKMFDACTRRENYHVIVEPEASPSWGPSESTNAEAIVRDIRRHVDGVSQVFTRSDVVCKFCGAAWEVEDGTDFPEGQPVCGCDGALAIFDSLQEPPIEP